MLSVLLRNGSVSFQRLLISLKYQLTSTEQNYMSYFIFQYFKGFLYGSFLNFKQAVRRDRRREVTVNEASL